MDKKGSAVLPIPELSGSEQAVIGQGQKAGNGAGQKPQNHADAAHLCVEAEVPIEAVQVLRAGQPHPLPEGAESEVDDQGIKPGHRRPQAVAQKEAVPEALGSVEKGDDEKEDPSADQELAPFSFKMASRLRLRLSGISAALPLSPPPPGDRHRQRPEDP